MSSELQTETEIAADFLNDYVTSLLTDALYTRSGAPDPLKLVEILPVSTPPTDPASKTGYDLITNTGYSIYSVIDPSNLNIGNDYIPTLSLTMIDPPNVCTVCMNPSWDTAAVNHDILSPNCTYVPSGSKCKTGSFPATGTDITGLPTCNICSPPEITTNVPPSPVTGLMYQGINSSSMPPFLKATQQGGSTLYNPSAYILCNSSTSPCPTTIQTTPSVGMYYLTNHPGIVLGLTTKTSTTDSFWRLFKISYDFSNPITEINKLSSEQINKFLGKSMKWLGTCCTRSQSISSVSTTLHSQICGNGDLRSDIYGMPTTQCDDYATKHCVGGSTQRQDYCRDAGDCAADTKDTSPKCQDCLYRNKDEIACSCFEWNKTDDQGKLVAWRGPINTTIDDDPTLGKEYDSKLYRFMKDNNPTHLSRKCVLSNCKDIYSYKTSDMLRTNCPELCTSMLYNTITDGKTDPSNHSTTNINDVKITVRCGSADTNYYQGQSSLAPGYKPPSKPVVRWPIYLLIGLVVAGIIGGVVAYVIIKRRKK